MRTQPAPFRSLPLCLPGLLPPSLRRYMTRYDADYPVGRARLEALSVLACAFIMTMASIEVIQVRTCVCASVCLCVLYMCIYVYIHISICM